MQLNDLLHDADIDPSDVIVFRHCPKHLPELRGNLLQLAAENHDLFNAYQQTQGRVVENAMLKAKYIAAFVGHEPGKAIFAGLYEIDGHRAMTYKEFWMEPLNVELQSSYGMVGMEDRRGKTLWFNLVLLPFQKELRRRLVIRWPGKERSWWRWADRNKFVILDGPRLRRRREGATLSRPSGGAGFGDSAENALVEAAAIGTTTTAYENDGWTVRSVERDKCGFDLDCRKGRAVRNVEVKGVRGPQPSFAITAGEVKQARTNLNFVLAVVTSALTKAPRLTQYSGKEFCRRFDLFPIQYRAVLRS